MTSRAGLIDKPTRPRYTAAVQGFRMPAEWALHDAVWTAWPHDPEQWAEGLEAPRRALMAMCSAIVDGGAGERVELLVRNDDDERAARELLGAAAAHVRFHHGPYGDIWLRDTGPIFVVRDRDSSRPNLQLELAAARFSFDGWGGKYVMPGDTEVADRVSQWSRIPGARFDFVLEGGAIDVDGKGMLLTTRQCLLGGSRNPGLDVPALEARLRWSLGVDNIGWLDQGLINDHTDGHVDTIARFIAPGVVMCMEPAPTGDPNHDALAAILNDLRAMAFEVVTVPSPGAVTDGAGNLMPASYTNFYIANTTLVVPTYGVASDEPALAALQKMFPTRRVVGVTGKPVVVGGGAFHCATQQQPATVAA